MQPNKEIGFSVSNFCNKAHSNSQDHYTFDWTYALYLDQCLNCVVYEQKQRGDGGGGSAKDGYNQFEQRDG